MLTPTAIAQSPGDQECDVDARGLRGAVPMDSGAESLHILVAHPLAPGLERFRHEGPATRTPCHMFWQCGGVEAVLDGAEPHDCAWVAGLQYGLAFVADFFHM